jgi:hypothetical protein
MSDCKGIGYIFDIAILLNIDNRSTLPYWNFILIECPPGYKDWKYIGYQFDNPFEFILIMEFI